MSKACGGVVYDDDAIQPGSPAYRQRGKQHRAKKAWRNVAWRGEKQQQHRSIEIVSGSSSNQASAAGGSENGSGGSETWTGIALRINKHWAHQ